MAKAVCFTVVADEVTDVSNKEQLSIVLRYYIVFTWASACTCSFPFIDMLTLMMLCVKMLFGFV